MSESKLLDVVRVRQMCLNGEARRTRVEAGVTLEELAATIGASPQGVNRWERGVRRPRFAAAIAYGEALRHIEDVPRQEFRPAEGSTAEPTRGASRRRCPPDDPVIEWLRSLTPNEIRRIYRRAGKYRDWVAKQIPASPMTVQAWEQGKISNGAACRRFGELLMELEDDWSVAYYRRCLDAVAECSA